MSGSKTTDISDGARALVRFTVRYCDVLFPDGVTAQGPVGVAFDGDWISAQVGSFRSVTAYA